MVNVEELMARPGMDDAMNIVREKLESDAEVSALLKAVRSVEEAYEVVKRCVVIKFEDFKELCSDMMDYFKDDKVALNDEVLDSVAGGAWGLSKFWNNVVVGSITAVCVAACGAAIGALSSLCGMGFPGTVAGGLMGYVVADQICQAIGISWE